MAVRFDPLLKTLGLRLRELRLERGLTQQELAERCELTTKYISELERGLRNPSLKTVHRIARAGLRTSLAVFLFHVDDAVDAELVQSAGERPASYEPTGTEPRMREREERIDALLAGQQAAQRDRLLDLFERILSLTATDDRAAVQTRRSRGRRRR